MYKRVLAKLRDTNGSGLIWAVCIFMSVIIVLSAVIIVSTTYSTATTVNNIVNTASVNAIKNNYNKSYSQQRDSFTDIAVNSNDILSALHDAGLQIQNGCAIKYNSDGSILYKICSINVTAVQENSSTCRKALKINYTLYKPIFFGGNHMPAVNVPQTVYAHPVSEFK